MIGQDVKSFKPVHAASTFLTEIRYRTAGSRGHVIITRPGFILMEAVVELNCAGAPFGDAGLIVILYRPLLFPTGPWTRTKERRWASTL